MIEINETKHTHAHTYLPGISAPDKCQRCNITNHADLLIFETVKASSGGAATNIYNRTSIEREIGGMEVKQVEALQKKGTNPCTNSATLRGSRRPWCGEKSPALPHRPRSPAPAWDGRSTSPAPSSPPPHTWACDDRVSSVEVRPLVVAGWA